MPSKSKIFLEGLEPAELALKNVFESFNTSDVLLVHTQPVAMVFLLFPRSPSEQVPFSILPRYQPDSGNPFAEAWCCLLWKRIGRGHQTDRCGEYSMTYGKSKLGN